ncbi:hypothetical protein D3C76_1232400 [compost metagenome]
MPFAQVVVQALMEFASADGFAQVDTRRGDQAHIYRVRLLGTHADDFTVFQRSKQFDLNGQRQVGDFIQVQGAAIG